MPSDSKCKIYPLHLHMTCDSHQNFRTEQEKTNNTQKKRFWGWQISSAAGKLMEAATQDRTG